MHKVWAKKRGFTIVELLICIAVIGILAGIMIVSYTNIQQRSRDSRRSSDITKIRLAIDKYRAEKSMYPPACPSGDNSGCTVNYLATYLAPYLDSIPHDPKNAINSTTDYQYVRGVVTNDSYALRVYYEAKPSCKTGTNVDAGWWGATVLAC